VNVEVGRAPVHHRSRGEVLVTHEPRSGPDLWRVWDEQCAEILESVHRALSGHAELGPIIRAIPVELVRTSVERVVADARAAGGDESERIAAALVEWVRRSPASALGVPAWFDASAAVQEHLRTALIRAYGGEPARLGSALDHLQRTADRALAGLVQERLGSGEAMVAAQRKQIDEARLRFDRLAESGILGIIVCDLVGNILEANDGFLAMVGYTREELLSGSVRWAEMTPPEWEQLDREAVDQLIATGATRPWEKEYLRKDGSRVPILVGVAMLDETKCVAFVLDITERKHLDELRVRSIELENENRRIQEANRLKSEFLANMSHELRTPLNSIIGFADILHDGEVSPDSPQHRELLGDILQSGRHLLQLINDILDLAKIEAGKLDFYPEPMELAGAIAEVCSVLRQVAAGKGIRLEWEVDADVDRVVLDPSRLKQILYNYVSNALKFTGEGGRVGVRARTEDEQSFRLEVEDTGIGIAQADLSRLFVEFHQLDSGAAKRHAGTGLGLALTKRIVEAQGGSVGVKSVLGAGSVFHAVLPRRAARTASDSRPPLVARELQHEGSNAVLVVDDDPGDQAILARVLGRAGYGVDVVGSGLEAVRACRERVFGAITLDLLLPDINGLEVLRRIRTEGKNRATPVVVVSVVAERGVVGAFPVHDYLRKPVDGGDLVTTLQHAGLSPERSGSILVVDDDPLALKLMETALRQIGYRAEVRSDGASALDLAAREPPLAVIVDLLMPGMDGFDFLTRFRTLSGCHFSPAIVWTMKDLTPEDHARLSALAHSVVEKGARGSASLEEELGALLARPHPVAGGE
jgi:PAS domain S-box-containing protein